MVQVAVDQSHHWMVIVCFALSFIYLIGPHHHLDLLVADPGGAAGQGAAGVAAPALASDGEEGKLVHVKLNVKVQVMVRKSVHV